jgi:ELWxxDGT repeat protein
MAFDLVRSPLFFAFPYFPTSSLRQVGGAYLFPHDDGIHGAELWRTDGTAEGTWMVKDVCPGACMGVGTWDRHVFEGLYWFPGNDGVHGMELWVSDGTAAGTRMVADLVPGTVRSEPTWITSLPNRLFWAARGPDGEGALWTLEDGQPSHVVATETYSGPVIALDDVLLFADDGTLWTVDSSLTMTALHPGVLTPPSSSYPFLSNRSPWVVHGGRFYFPGQTAGEGEEPWVSDGTPEGTLLLADLDPGSGNSLPRDFVPVGAEVFFRALSTSWDWELWAVDTSGAVRRVFELDEVGLDSVGDLLVSDGSQLLFLGRTTALGAEPYVTDGTAAGTHLVKDVNPGAGSSLDGLDAWYLPRLPRTPGRFFFAADDGVHGLESWITDGTEEATEMLADIFTGTSGFPDEEAGSFEYLAGEVAWTGSEYFFVPYEGTAGKEPWKSDGTPAGTQRIANLFDQSTAFLACLWPYHPQPCPALVPQGDRLFFTAIEEPSSGDVWDGLLRLLHTEGVSSVHGVVPFYDDAGNERSVWATSYDGPAAAGDRLVLKRDSNLDVWSTDGTEEGTGELVDFEGSTEYPWVGSLEPFAGRVVFAANGELWQTDGSPEGTLNLGAASSGGSAPPGSFPNHYLVASSGLYWSAPGAIWRMPPGGAPAPVASLPGAWAPELMGSPGVASDADVPSRLLFWYQDDDRGSEPWVLDELGPRLLADLRIGPEGSRVTYPRDVYTEDPGVFHLAGAAGSFVFFVADAGTGPTLWRSDGAGLASLAGPDGPPVRPLWLTPAGDRVFFAAESPGHGRELWVSDGTDAGTRMLEIAPGEDSSIPQYLTVIGDALVFRAFHPATGVELWISDGTIPGTQLFQDLHPGPGSSSPTSLIAAERFLWLVANDGIHGFELWVAPLDDAIFADGFESGGTDRWLLGES